MKYAMVIGGKGDQRKDPLGLHLPSRVYAIEHHRSEGELERRVRSVRSAGGVVVAVGLESDARFLQRAKVSVAQMTAGSWSVEKAREYLMEHLRTAAHDPFIATINAGGHHS